MVVFGLSFEGPDMDYGGKPHKKSEADLNVIYCPRHGWSQPITMQEWRNRGLPLYCDVCGISTGRFINYALHEQPEVDKIIGSADRWQTSR